MKIFRKIQREKKSIINKEPLQINKKIAIIPTKKRTSNYSKLTLIPKKYNTIIIILEESIIG